MTPGMPDPIQVPNAARFKCPDCQGDVDIMIRRPTLLNSPLCSAVICTHETPDTCPKCGATFLMKIVGITPQFMLQVIWVKLSTKESALIPGNEASFKNALEHAKTIDQLTGRKQ